MSRKLTNGDDVVDSRDVIARIEELEGERTELSDAADEAKQRLDEAVKASEDDSAIETLQDELEVVQEELKDFDDGDDGEELKELKELAEEGENATSEWPHGATLIRDGYFEDYCQEMVVDIGDLPKNIPSYLAIDWEKTAENIQSDYTSIEWGNETYWVR